MRARTLVFVLVASLAVRAEAATPTPVSPGAADRFTDAASTCPTFSWGNEGRPRAHEIAVWQVDGLEESIAVAEPVLRIELPGSALSWTPSADRCLAPGESFAWSVREIDGEGRRTWSEPSLFRTPASLTRTDLLDLLRRLDDGEPDDTKPADETAPPVVEIARPPRPRTGPPTATPGTTVIEVDGEFGYASPRERRLTLSVMQFVVEDSAEDEVFVINNGGYISIFSGAGTLDLELVASADIPDVASVFSMTILIYDNNPNQHVSVDCSLRAKILTQTGSTELAAVSSMTTDPGMADSVQQHQASIPPVAVDQKALIVSCRYEQSALGTSLRFYGALVRYEVPFAD